VRYADFVAFLRRTRTMTADERHVNDPEELADRRLVDALTAMDFRTPSLATLWNPTKAAMPAGGPLHWLRSPRQLGLRTAIAAVALALATTGVAMAELGILPIPFELNARVGCPDPDSCGPNYEVTSRTHSEIPAPYNVEAFNVVVAPGTNRDQITAIANAFAARHTTGGRTTVYFFSESAGQERYAGVRPSTADAAAEPAPTPAVVQAWLGLFDFAPNGKAIVRWGPGT
jgi:hypothetical protein